MAAHIIGTHEFALYCIPNLMLCRLQSKLIIQVIEGLPLLLRQVLRRQPIIRKSLILLPLFFQLLGRYRPNNLLVAIAQDVDVDHLAGVE